MVVGVALATCSDRHLAEDAAQEAFATAARQLASLRRTEQFPSWLRTICRRTATRLRRRHQRMDALPNDPPAKIQSAPDPRVATLTQALQQLDDTSREVLVLRYFSDLSHAQIAESLGRTEAAIHGLLQRARRKLAQRMRRTEETPLKEEPSQEVSRGGLHAN